MINRKDHQKYWSTVNLCPVVPRSRWIWSGRILALRCPQHQHSHFWGEKIQAPRFTIALFDQVAPAFIIIEHSVLGHIRKLFDWQDQVGAKIAQIMPPHRYWSEQLETLINYLQSHGMNHSLNIDEHISQLQSICRPQLIKLKFQKIWIFLGRRNFLSWRQSFQHVWHDACQA